MAKSRLEKIRRTLGGETTLEGVIDAMGKEREEQVLERQHALVRAGDAPRQPATLRLQLHRTSLGESAEREPADRALQHQPLFLRTSLVDPVRGERPDQRHHEPQDRQHDQQLDQREARCATHGSTGRCRPPT